MTGGQADDAIQWLLNHGFELRFLDDVLAGVCERLREAGLPLDRVTLHARALHPQFRAARLLWEPELQEVELTRVGDEILSSQSFLQSPVRALFEGAEGVRQRLDVPAGEDAFPIYADLRARGFTDYVALPLPFTNGQRMVSSWATRRSGGWLTEELIEIDRLRPVLAMASEIRIVRRMARNVAETYLGRRTGTRVLEGAITRGDLETVDAAIAYLDMRDFTSFAERTAQERVILRLNRFFDAFGAAIEAHDGEILKFLGDGMLSIFPLDDDERSAATRAFDAAIEGFRNLKRLNEELAKDGEEQIACGLGLHLGPVSYGNIGTASRLDFTVVGAAVNLAARLQTLCRELSEPFVMSETVAQAAGRPTRALGRHGVRGVPRAMPIFAPVQDLLG